MAQNLGEIFVTIRAKADKLQSDLSAAGGAFVGFSSKVSASLTGLRGHLSTVTGLLGAAGLALGAREAVQAFLASEKSVARLDAALAKLGAGAAAEKTRLNALAAQMQDLTGFSDDAITSVQALLVSFGASGDELDRATRLVADFTAQIGGDLESNARLFAKSVDGANNALARYGIRVDEGISDSERFAQVLDQVEAKFGGVAERLGQTIPGQMNRLRETLGDVSESLGAMILKLVSLDGNTDGLIAKIRAFQAEIDKLRQSEGFSTLAAGVSDVVISMGELLTEIAKLGGEMEGTATASGVLLSALGELIHLIAEVFRGINGLIGVLGLISPEFEGLARKAIGLAAQLYLLSLAFGGPAGVAAAAKTARAEMIAFQAGSTAAELGAAGATTKVALLRGGLVLLVALIATEVIPQLIEFGKQLLDLDKDWGITLGLQEDRIRRIQQVTDEGLGGINKVSDAINQAAAEGREVRESDIAFIEGEREATERLIRVMQSAPQDFPGISEDPAEVQRRANALGAALGIVSVHIRGTTREAEAAAAAIHQLTEEQLRTRDAVVKSLAGISDQASGFRETADSAGAASDRFQEINRQMADFRSRAAEVANEIQKAAATGIDVSSFSRMLRQQLNDGLTALTELRDRATTDASRAFNDELSQRAAGIAARSRELDALEAEADQGRFEAERRRETAAFDAERQRIENETQSMIVQKSQDAQRLERLERSFRESGTDEDTAAADAAKRNAEELRSQILSITTAQNFELTNLRRAHRLRMKEIGDAESEENRQEADRKLSEEAERIERESALQENADSRHFDLQDALARTERERLQLQVDRAAQAEKTAGRELTLLEQIGVESFKTDEERERHAQRLADARENLERKASERVLAEVERSTEEIATKERELLRELDERFNQQKEQLRHNQQLQEITERANRPVGVQDDGDAGRARRVRETQETEAILRRQLSDIEQVLNFEKLTEETRTQLRQQARDLRNQIRESENQEEEQSLERITQARIAAEDRASEAMGRAFDLRILRMRDGEIAFENVRKNLSQSLSKFLIDEINKEVAAFLAGLARKQLAESVFANNSRSVFSNLYAGISQGATAAFAGNEGKKTLDAGVGLLTGGGGGAGGIGGGSGSGGGPATQGMGRQLGLMPGLEGLANLVTPQLAIAALFTGVQMLGAKQDRKVAESEARMAAIPQIGTAIATADTAFGGQAIFNAAENAADSRIRERSAGGGTILSVPVNIQVGPFNVGDEDTLVRRVARETRGIVPTLEDGLRRALAGEAAAGARSELSGVGAI